MGRRRKRPKHQISTRSGIILSGSIVAIVFVILLFIVIRSSFPSRNRDWDDARGFRDIRPAPLARTVDEAWKLLKGRWVRTEQAGNAVATIEYEFTDDRRAIVRDSSTDGPNGKAGTNEMAHGIVGLELDEGDILLFLDGDRGEWLVHFESPQVLVIDEYEFRRLE